MQSESRHQQYGLNSLPNEVIDMIYKLKHELETKTINESIKYNRLKAHHYASKNRYDPLPKPHSCWRWNIEQSRRVYYIYWRYYKRVYDDDEISQRIEGSILKKNSVTYGHVYPYTDQLREYYATIIKNSRIEEVPLNTTMMTCSRIVTNVRFHDPYILNNYTKVVTVTIANQRKTELKELCRVNRLKVSGTKNELIKRLMSI